VKNAVGHETARSDGRVRAAELTLTLLAVTAGAVWAGELGNNHFPTFPDRNTVALWLFDEAVYPHVTLTDAGLYEYDLCLMPGGRLVTGRFGRALQVSPSPESAVAYAGFKGVIPLDHMREEEGPSGLWGPTIAPEHLLTTLAEGSWTLELWLRLPKGVSDEVTLLDLGHAYEPGLRLNLEAGESRLSLEDHYAGLAASCPTRTDNLADGRWHHLAFTYDRDTGSVRHFLDGLPLEEPETHPIPAASTPPVVVPEDRSSDSFGFTASATHEWRRGHRFNIALGHDRRGARRIEGEVDELRLSRVVRYLDEFPVPGSLSRNYGPHAPKPAAATGPPPLSAPDSPPEPVRLGSRRHIFIDGGLLEKHEDLRLTVNPPTGWQALDLDPGGQASILDRDGEVFMYLTAGYSSAEGRVRLLVSRDGLGFRVPESGTPEREGAPKNDVVLSGAPMYGVVFEDQNPNIGREERFKLTAWVANRGIYLYVSPDGIHWRRNEAAMLPLVSGGAAESYWDDQRGLYVTLLKRDSDFNTAQHPGHGRRAVGFETREITRPWPFEALAEPLFAGWPMPVVTGEGPVVFGPSRRGEVFRTRALKYPWAPDVYLAFLWRFDEQENRITDLGVSRDGVRWRFYADQDWYLGGFDEYVEAMAHHGLVRRGDEIWQYAEYGTGAHGAGGRVFARVVQRLDGFVSLDAGSTTGTAVTRPLVFAGRRLELNVAAEGEVRVELRDEAGEPWPGRTRDDCDPIRADSVRREVTWGGESDLSALAGKVVRLRFEMTNAKLYALQFVD
jgi:hypothetical protein